MRFSMFPLSVALGVLGLSLIHAPSAYAVQCDPFAIGIEADNCRSQIKIGSNTASSASIEQFKLSLAKQLPIAIASYNRTFATTIAQQRVRPTIVVSQGSMKNLPVLGLSVSNTPQIALTSR